MITPPQFPLTLRPYSTEIFTGAIHNSVTLVVSDSGWKPDTLFVMLRVSPAEMAAIRAKTKAPVFGIPLHWCEENGWFKTWPLPAAVCTVKEESDHV